MGEEKKVRPYGWTELEERFAAGLRAMGLTWKEVGACLGREPYSVAKYFRQRAQGVPRASERDRSAEQVGGGSMTADPLRRETLSRPAADSSLLRKGANKESEDPLRGETLSRLRRQLPSAEGSQQGRIGRQLPSAEGSQDCGEMSERERRAAAGRLRYGDQLCWHCAKAVGYCVWSASKCRETVPGWTAEEIPARSGSPADSGPWYRIYVCPEFVEG